MQPFNRGFIPLRSSADPNQSSNPTHPVSPVPTRPTPYGSGFVDFKQHNTGLMNLLNQPLTWDPNLYGWNPNQNMDGMGSSQAFRSAQAFSSPLRDPEVVPETQPEVEESKKEKQNAHIKRKRKTERKKKTCNRGMTKRSTC
ncbi:hypothetical protein Hanom_Chr11g01031661 [Helianthus anomalus]